MNTRRQALAPNGRRGRDGVEFAGCLDALGVARHIEVVACPRSDSFMVRDPVFSLMNSTPWASLVGVDDGGTTNADRTVIAAASGPNPTGGKCGIRHLGVPKSTAPASTRMTSRSGLTFVRETAMPPALAQRCWGIAAPDQPRPLVRRPRADARFEALMLRLTCRHGLSPGRARQMLT